MSGYVAVLAIQGYGIWVYGQGEISPEDFLPFKLP
jgi:hypothetical protein